MYEAFSGRLVRSCEIRDGVVEVELLLQEPEDRGELDLAVTDLLLIGDRQLGMVDYTGLRLLAYLPFGGADAPAYFGRVADVEFSRERVSTALGDVVPGSHVWQYADVSQLVDPDYVADVSLPDD